MAKTNVADERHWNSPVWCICMAERLTPQPQTHHRKVACPMSFGMYGIYVGLRPIHGYSPPLTVNDGRASKTRKSFSDTYAQGMAFEGPLPQRDGQNTRLCGVPYL